MDLWSSALVSSLLVACAAGLMVWHVGAWRAAGRGQWDAAEHDYRRRQFRRRMQTSAMLGVAGAAIFVGQLLVPWAGSALFTVLFWGGTVLLLLWIALLAVADIVATKYHFGRLRHDNLVEQARLQAEIRRLQAARRNGEPPRD
jgi:hypothetical protein